MQELKTPPISDCWCGAKAKLIDWDFRDQWRVMCDKNHTLTKECGTTHRATCLWNNRVIKKLNDNKRKDRMINVVSDQQEDLGFKHYIVFGDSVAPWDAEDKNVVECLTEGDAHKLKGLILGLVI